MFGNADHSNYVVRFAMLGRRNCRTAVTAAGFVFYIPMYICRNAEFTNNRRHSANTANGWIGRAKLRVYMTSCPNIEMNAPGQPETIFLVDHRVLISAAIQALLCDEKRKIVCSADLHEVFSYARQQSVSLVVVGCESLAAATAALATVKSECSDIPVALLIPDGSVEDLIKLFHAGASGVFHSSLSRDEFVDGILATLRGLRFAPRALLLEHFELSLSSSLHHCALPGNRDECAASADTESQVRLSAREREILSFLAKGNSNKEIARVLGISVGTVKNYVASLLQRFEVTSRGKLLSAICLNHPSLMEKLAHFQQQVSGVRDS